MSQYLLSVHAAPSGGDQAQSMTPEMMQEFMGRIIALEAEMEDTGTFVFSGRLVRNRCGDSRAVERWRHGHDRWAVMLKPRSTSPGST